MRVFVTGGSGFIGQRLVRALLASGHQVVCLSRSGRSSALLAELGADVLSGNLGDPESLRGALDEAKPTHVAHLAAEIATQRSKEKIEQTNVVGTRDLIAACRDANLRKFLFISPVVRGDANGQMLTEDQPILATTDYGKSKAQGDEMVLAAHAEWGFPGVILRPSHVYGAGGWFAEIVNSKIARIPGDGSNWWDMVHVDDVVSAGVLLLENAEPGNAFHVVDDEPVTMAQVFAEVAKAAGRKPYKKAPVWMAKLGFGKGAIEAMVRSAKSSNAKLKGLGWRPEHPNSLASLAPVVREILGLSEDRSAQTPATEDGEQGPPSSALPNTP